MKAPISVVWLKRDLRLHDHAALQAAIAEGLPILLLYVFEPSLRKAETYDTRHACFVWESLEDLHKQLAPFQGQIQVVEGEVLELFQKLQTYFDIHGIYAHQETGIFLTYQRDILVETYLKAQRIPLHTFPQDGVERGRMNREGWEEDWKKYMSAPPANIRVEEISFAQLPQALSETFGLWIIFLLGIRSIRRHNLEEAHSAHDTCNLFYKSVYVTTRVVSPTPSKAVGLVAASLPT